MRGVRLNRWQRIGIVLSVLWAVVGGLWGYHLATQEAIATPLAHYKSCISKPYYDDDECSHTSDEEYAAGLRDHWAFAVTMASLVSRGSLSTWLCGRCAGLGAGFSSRPRALRPSRGQSS